jgi:CBS-domain-containing membrane protein
VLAKDLLNINFEPLRPSSTIQSALAKMDAWYVKEVPVIEPSTRKLIGVVTLDQLSEIVDEGGPLSNTPLKSPVFVYENQHLFEVARKMLQFECRLIPVTDGNETFLGIVEKKEVLEALSKMLNITTKGSVITVEMEQADFMLSELVRLIEMEEAKILGLTVEEPTQEYPGYRVSIKISHIDTSAVVSTLRRHGYLTISENRDDLIQLDLSSRADELVRYLDV